MSLEGSPSPVELSDETPALAGTMIAAMRDPEAEAQLSCVWIPDSQKL